MKPRSDAELLQLLAKARAQGVRRLQLRPDGGFLAEMDPLPLAPPVEPEKPKRSTEEQAKAEAKDYEEHMLHSAEG